MHRAILIDVVEQPSRLVLLDIETGESHEPARVVARIHYLGLDRECGAVADLLHVNLTDVESHLVELPDAFRHVQRDV